MMLGWGYVIAATAMGIPIEGLDWIPVTSFTVAGPFYGWLYSHDLPAKVETFKAMLKEKTRWIQKMLDDEVAQLLPPEALDERGNPKVLVPESIDSQWLDDMIRMSYDFESGSFDLCWDSTDIKIASTSFKLSADKTDLLIDSLSVGTTIEAITGGTVSATEAARLLILHAYTVNEDLLVAGSKIGIANTYANTADKPARLALGSLVTEGYLTELGLSSGYYYYQIEASMLAAGFTISEQGVPGTTVVEGTPAAPTFLVGPVSSAFAVIQGGLFKGKALEFMPDGTVRMTLPDGDVVTLGRDELLALYNAQHGAGNMPFKFINGDGTEVLVSLGAGGQVTIGSLSLDLSVANVAMRQLAPSAQLEASTLRWITEVMPKTEAAVDAFLAQTGSAQQGRFALFTRSASGVECGIMFDSDVKLTMSDWKLIKKKIPELVIENESGQPVGHIKLLERAGEFEVDGKVFRPNAPAGTKGIINMEELVQKDADVLKFKNVEAASKIHHEWHFDLKNGRFAYVRKGVGIQKCNLKLAGLWGDVARGDVIYEGTWKGSKTISITTREELSPLALKRNVYKAINLLSHPGTVGLLTGASKMLVIYNKYNADEYICMDELYGDVVGAAFYAGSWSTHAFVLRRFSHVLFSGMGIGASLGTGFVLALPMMVISDAVEEYTKQVTLQWESGQAIDGVTTLTDLNANYETLYRAWLMTHDALNEDWLHPLAEVYRSPNRDYLEWAITEGIQERWLATPEGQAADDEAVKTHYFLAMERAGLYGVKYQDLIYHNGLMYGLSWAYPGLIKWDEYGFSRIEDQWDYIVDYPYPGPGGPAPVSAYTVTAGDNDMTEVMARQVYGLWKILAEGDKAMDPVSEYLDYTPSLEEVLTLARGDIAWMGEMFKAHLDGSMSSWPFGIGVDQLWKTDQSRWADCRTGTNTCATLLEYLTPDAMVGAGLYEAVTANPGAEGAGEFAPQVSHQDSAVPTNTYTVPAEETLGGVRYHWDVKAHNPVGWGPESEQWNFISDE